ncbi:MAG: trypsin-like peptidase domain-containing protein [Gemmatimonadota bacterium]
MSSRFRRRAAVGTGALALGVLIGGGAHAAFVATEHVVAEATPEHRTSIDWTDPASLAQGVSEATADLAARVTPAVVQISVKLAPSPQDEEQLPDQFRRFFDLPFGNPQAPNPQPQPRFGGGSGFLVSADGYIVTNNHVAGEAEEITVRLNDNRTFKATLVGADPTTDVAVIKIDAKGLPFLAWGDSEALRVGEWVMAIGNPGFGGSSLDYTVTTGIVSAKGRPLQLIGRDLEQDPRFGREMAGYAIENFIQTDAVINPGNSGGPMVDMAGDVVGVNSAIASTDGHFQGYGFAIPSHLVQKIAHDLMTEGRVLRPWLGVQVVQVSPEDAEAFRLPDVSGVLVQAVTDDSPADAAGLLQGDVIVAVDGKAVMSGGSLQEMIAVRRQGERVDVEYYRDGSRRSTEVRLGEAPVNPRATADRRPQGSTTSAEVEHLGLSVRPLTRDLAEQLGYEHAGGIAVAEIDPSGPAALKGITSGMQLLEIDGRRVDSVEDATDAFHGVEAGKVVTLLLGTPASGTRLVNVRAR